MLRAAKLVENKKNRCLDVCIENQGFEKGAYSPQKAIGNNNDHVVRGTIHFQDDRNPKDILMEFVSIYPCVSKIGEDHNQEFCFARYQQHITIIPLAFVNYFSPK